MGRKQVEQLRSKRTPLISKRIKRLLKRALSFSLFFGALFLLFTFAARESSLNSQAYKLAMKTREAQHKKVRAVLGP